MNDNQVITLALFNLKEKQKKRTLRQWQLESAIKSVRQALPHAQSGEQAAQILGIRGGSYKFWFVVECFEILTKGPAETKQSANAVEPTCRSCIFWRMVSPDDLCKGDSILIDDESDDPKTTVIGECRRFPPTIVNGFLKEREGRSEPANIDHATKFPIIWGYEVCGEHKPK